MQLSLSLGEREDGMEGLGLRGEGDGGVRKRGRVDEHCCHEAGHASPCLWPVCLRFMLGRVKDEGCCDCIPGVSWVINGMGCWNLRFGEDKRGELEEERGGQGKDEGKGEAKNPPNED